MLELKNINVSFRSERQDKIFGHTRQQCCLMCHLP